jgi:hypothetical protein
MKKSNMILNMENRGMQQYRHGTRMTRIGRISTDTHYPCASVSSAQSVFYRKIAKFDDDNKPQMKAPRVAPLEGASTYASALAYVLMHRGWHNSDERRYFCASNFNKTIHRKERKVQRMISFRIRKTTEGTKDTEKINKTLCSLCSPWLNNLAGINYGGFDARAREYFMCGRGNPP